MLCGRVMYLGSISAGEGRIPFLSLSLSDVWELINHGWLLIIHFKRCYLSHACWVSEEEKRKIKIDLSKKRLAA